MTEIKESSANILTIIYTRSWLNRIFYLIPAIMFLGFAVCLVIWFNETVESAVKPAFAPVLLVVFIIGFLAGGIIFLSSVFDRTTYHFDKIKGEFRLNGRRNFIRKWSVEGSPGDIINISYEITGQDENTVSEIYLKYRFYGSVVETIKCGTGEEIEDDIITAYIKGFLEPEKGEMLIAAKP